LIGIEMVQPFVEKLNIMICVQIFIDGRSFLNINIVLSDESACTKYHENRSLRGAY
jgi:hypothetical protein